MITYSLLTLWGLFLIAICVIVLGYERVSYAFQGFDEAEIPYITIDIQGNQLNMIVDSACAVSMLNPKALTDCELLYKPTDKNVSLSAMTSDSIKARAITVEFNIGKKEVSEDFYLHATDDFANFGSWHNVVIHGLLGSSFFDKNKCSIDYESHSLIV